MKYELWFTEVPERNDLNIQWNMDLIQFLPQCKLQNIYAGEDNWVIKSASNERHHLFTFIVCTTC